MHNIEKLISIFEAQECFINDLKIGLKNHGEQRKILNDFLTYIGCEENEEFLYAAYVRLCHLKADPLRQSLQKLDYSDPQIQDILQKAYVFTLNFYSQIYTDSLKKVKENRLLDDFYETVVEGSFQIGGAISKWYIRWNQYIIDTLNVSLENTYKSQQEIIQFLSQNDLLQKDSQGNISDRAYSSLREIENGYQVLSYSEIFEKEIEEILQNIEELIHALEEKKDNIYDQKIQYIDYFQSLYDAFSEKNVDQLIKKWRRVDTAWLQITTPIQICHPFEFYEDLYRKSVAPEWDIRIKNDTIMDTHIKKDIQNMFLDISAEFMLEHQSDIVQYSQKALDTTQLYISDMAMLFGSELNGPCSAQVIPNDEYVSHNYGKKIYAFPKVVLQNQKSSPKTLIDSQIFSENFLNDYYSLLEDAQTYYKVYDIETIGHEFGHTLWLGEGSEVLMNRTGNFKNIEEFKATAGGLVAYFLSDDSSVDREVFLLHIARCIRMIRYQQVDEIVCYYNECMIHLDILFASGCISLDNNRVELHTDKIAQAKALYIEIYKKCIETYVNKADAGEFLYNFVDQEDKIFLPKNNTLRDFVLYYYECYQNIGHQIVE